MSSLPKLMLIADGFVSGRSRSQSAEDILQVVLDLVEGGLSFIQLRDHDAREDHFRTAAIGLVDQIRVIQPDTTITINSRAAIARELNCGLHLRSSDLTVSAPETRGVRGGSTHNPDEVRQARHAGFDYITFSPIFSTQTHPEATPVGVDSLRGVCTSAAELPVFALGGVDPDRARDCLDVGAHGVAVLSDLLDSPDPRQRLEAYKEAGVL